MSGADAVTGADAGEQPDAAWVEGVRKALATVPFPVCMPDGRWDDAFLTDAQLVDGVLLAVAVAAVSGEVWVEVHSGLPGHVDVAERFAEQGLEDVAGTDGSPGSVDLDGAPLPGRSWHGPDATVTLLDGQDVVRTVTVTGTAAEVALRTVDDLEPLLDAYLMHLGWEAL